MADAATHVEAASTSQRWWYAIVGLWLVAVIACMAMLWRYKAKPGAPAEAPQHWPEASAIPHVPGVPTLVLFAHPECPCTKATLEELSAVMSHAGGKVTATVMFVRPPGAPADWENTETRRRADDIAGVTVRIDIGGVEAERFGAKTSGQVVVYDQTGELRFAGGITGARGHMGDNIGRQRVLALLDGHPADAPNAYVFGCELFGETRR